jgi:acyl-CoA dehydrogenase
MIISNEFRDSAARLFGDVVTPAVLEAAEGGVFPQALWDAINTSGFGLVLVPEEQGGVGAGMQEAASVMLAAGEHAAPGPLLELVLGNKLLALAGRESSSRPLALAFAKGTVGAGQPVTLRNVAWASAADQVLVVGRTVTGTGLAIVPGRQLEARAELADALGEPSASLTLPAQTVWHALPATDFDAVLLRAALLRGAQMIGAMRWCLERTTAYTLERKQFGREIGKFQVVQQMMAELASAVVAAHAMLDAAVAEPDHVALVGAARSRLGDAADIVFAHAHQVHGAIGFSYEYVLHFRTRRLMAWRDQFGSVAHWRRVLAAGFTGRKADEVWPVVAGLATGGPASHAAASHINTSV